MRPSFERSNSSVGTSWRRPTVPARGRVPFADQVLLKPCTETATRIAALADRPFASTAITVSPDKMSTLPRSPRHRSRTSQACSYQLTLTASKQHGAAQLRSPRTCQQTAGRGSLTCPSGRRTLPKSEEESPSPNLGLASANVSANLGNANAIFVTGNMEVVEWKVFDL